LYDCEETNAGTSLTDSDTDNDELTDYEEIHVYGTNPLSTDTDNDGISDNEEIQMGTNPLVETVALPKVLEELETTRILMYIFLATTIIFLLTTVITAILFIKRQK